MSVLRSIESKIADLIEGGFGRAFRSEITPVELARRLVREMDRNRQKSLSGVVVPNEYVVWLSPDDRRHLAPIEGSLLDELSAHLLEHARSERLALPSRPHIELRTDPRLALGACGIESRLSSSPPPPVARRYGVPPPANRSPYRPDRHVERPAYDDDPWGYDAGAGYDEPPAYPEPPAYDQPPPHDGRAAYAERWDRGGPPVAGEVLGSPWLAVDGQRVPIGAGGVLIGRSGDADIVIPAQEVSRRHAEIRLQDGGWVLVDLHSTNGVLLNRRPLTAPAMLRPGDVIEIGSVELTFEVG